MSQQLVRRVLSQRTCRDWESIHAEETSVIGDHHHIPTGVVDRDGVHVCGGCLYHTRHGSLNIYSCMIVHSKAYLARIGPIWTGRASRIDWRSCSRWSRAASSHVSSALRCPRSNEPIGSQSTTTAARRCLGSNQWTSRHRHDHPSAHACALEAHPAATSLTAVGACRADSSYPSSGLCDHEQPGWRSGAPRTSRCTAQQDLCPCPRRSTWKD